MQFVLPGAAETLFHRAENQVPVAIVEIDRMQDRTEIRLQAQATLAKVCFAASGPNSPYLLASGRNYRYLGGDNVSAVPNGAITLPGTWWCCDLSRSPRATARFLSYRARAVKSSR
jgi:hypothetical protein